MQQLYRRIHNDPKFHELEKKRGKFSWVLAFIVFIIYYSFILIIAFFPHIFAKTISENSVISWGIPTGLFVIIISFLMTGIYVYRANREFDSVSKEIVKHHINDELD
jgi:uncharacterized membrane protein (DUF485 family)